MKLEFLIPGSANDAFYSQLAMFRLALDSLGGAYEQARVVLCLNPGESPAAPSRWKKYLERVEVVQTPHGYGLRGGNNGLFRYELMGASSDVSILCDADTMFLRRFGPQEFDKFMREPAVRGVIAHFPPPLADEEGNNYTAQGPHHFWSLVARRCLGSEIPMNHVHTLMAEPTGCPFYVNYGVVVGNRDLFARIREELVGITPRVRAVLNNYFADQISLALACQAAGVPTEALPMRYNFPNDRTADSLYPHELDKAVIIHYLRTDCVDRHRIFTSADCFDDFLGASLAGSDEVFQKRVMEITGGTYPFG